MSVECHSFTPPSPKKQRVVIHPRYSLPALDPRPANHLQLVRILSVFFGLAFGADIA